MSINKKIQFYFPFFLIFLGFYRNSWLPGGNNLFGKEIWIILFASIIFLIYIYDYESLIKHTVRLFTRNNKYFTILFILLIISTVFYNIQELTKIIYLIRFLDYIIYFFIFSIMYPKYLNDNPFYFLKFVKLVSMIGFVTAVFGITLFFLNIIPDNKFEGSLVSFINQPNYVVFILNLGIISTIFYYDWQRENMYLFKKVFFISSFVIQLFATLLTLSRGGYIGIALGLIVYFAFKYKSKIVLILPVLITIIALILPPFFKAKGFASFFSRIYLLVPAYYMITRDKVSLLWGYGISNTFDEFLKYNNLYNIGEFHLNNPHNAFVSLILMFGIVFTAILFFFVSIMMIRVSIKSIREKYQTKSLFYAFLISTITMLTFQSIFDSEIVVIEFFSLQYMLIFLGLLNIIALRNRNSNLEICI